MTTTPDRTTQDQRDARAFLNLWLQDPAPNAKEAALLGYAGTGKTWLIGDWLESVLSADDCPEVVCIAAPTHKALDVLKQKCSHLPVTFKTLHSLLGLIVARREDGEIDKEYAEREERYTLLVVDEGSMVGLEFKKLIDDQIRKGGRIGKVLYVGDPAQLPPVKEALSPVFKVERNFTLRQVVRYDSAILNVATFLRTAISEGDSFSLPDILNVMQQTPEDRSVSIITKTALLKWASIAIAKGLDTRILAWTNAAVLAHNRSMHEICFPGPDYFAVGEKILLNDAYTLTKTQGGTQAKEDDPPDSLYNGEVLTTVTCELGEPVAGVEVFKVEATRADGRTVWLQFAPNEAHRLATHKALNEQIFAAGRDRYSSPEATAKFRELGQLRRAIFRLAPLRHSYACTVHKSQGSTYDISIVDFGDVYRSDDRSRLMYVAATRASKFLVLAR